MELRRMICVLTAGALAIVFVTAPERLVAAEASGAARATVAAPFGINASTGQQERETVYEFTAKPQVQKVGEKTVITFASKAACDATVGVVGPDGKVVRHLASGVLGKNAPWPFKQDSLSQSLEWDGKDDDGKPAPSGCKVKVSLGLDAKFNKVEGWMPMHMLKLLAIGPDGRLYAGTGMTTAAIEIFGKDGKYERTLMPPNAGELPGGKLSKENIGGIYNLNTTTHGDKVPERKSADAYGVLMKYVGFPDNLRPGGVVTPDGKTLCVLYSSEHLTALLMINIKDGACAQENVISLGKMVSNGAVASPDNKWLYFAGKVEKFAKNHAVLRMSMEKPATPEVFIGEVGKTGNDNTHFNTPDTVACDQSGNLYVGDTGNKRIQVYKPDGTYLKTLTVDGNLLGVNQKSGAIYVWKDKGPAGCSLAKLKSLDDPVKVAELAAVAKDVKMWSPGKNMLVSPVSDPPVIWFSGMIYGRQTPVIRKVEDRGASFEETVDLASLNQAPGFGVNNALFRTDPWNYYHVDRKNDKLLIPWPMGPDGLLYVRGQENADCCLFKMKPYGDPKRPEYVSFAVGEPAFGFQPGKISGAPALLQQDGKPVLGPRFYGATGPHIHMGQFCVAPNGDTYIGATYSKQSDEELAKAGLPRRLEKGALAGTYSTLVLRVYGADGSLKTPCALPGLVELEGLRVGRSGAVYIIQPWKPLNKNMADGLADGSSYVPHRTSTLLKFAGDFKTFPLGRVEGAWEPSPANPTHIESFSKRKVRVDGALWAYYGIGPTVSRYQDCTCLKTSADLDDYERSWVCAGQTCTINVIDSNGNVAARLGGFGNVDELMAGKRLTFGIPMKVAASDTTAWVGDMEYRMLASLKLVYHVEETVPVM